MNSEEVKKNEQRFSVKLATFIVDKRSLFCLLVVLGIVFSLFSRSWVKVENDLIAYLPAGSETKLGMDLMEEQFVTLGSAQIMAANVTYEKALELCEDIKEIDGVQSVSFDRTSVHYQNASALFDITFSYEEDDVQCETALTKIKERLADFDVYVSSEIGYSLPDIIAKEVAMIIVYVAIIIIAVLFVTSDTYAEIPVLLLTFVIAAILNMGTNFLMGTISFVSNSVTTILQLALSLDYAVILCNRYKEEHKTLPVREAVISALSKAIPEISASSLTTIGGLFAMLFMQFKIGPDMGINLIKSILFALLSVFVVMPALLMWFGPLMDKTKHKNFVPNVSFVGKFAYATRFIIPAVFVFVLAAAWKLSGDCPYAYGYSNLETVKLNEAKIAENMIADNFSSEEMVAVVVPAGDYESEGALLSAISEYEEVSSAMGLSNVAALGGYMLSDNLNPRAFSELADIDYELAQFVYAAYAVKEEEYARIISDISTYEVPLMDIFLFVCEQADAGLVTLEDAQMQMLEEAKVQISAAKAQLQGEDYSRMLVYLNIPQGGDSLYQFLDILRETAQEYYPEQNVYIVGNATSEYDFQKTFSTDNVVVSVLTILIVLAVLLFTFRSVGMPLLLIMVIQGSIWINFSVPTITQDNVFFMTYLIVSSIQMGANIDYAIVIASRYMELKDRMHPKQAIMETMNFAFPTILVSGTILATAGAFIGRMTSESSIANIGTNLARGTIISIILVMFVLPQILVIGSKLIDKTSFSVTNVRKTIQKGMAVFAVLLFSSQTLCVHAADAVTVQETIYIKDIEDLQQLAENCISDTWSVDKTVILQNDIDLTGIAFEPIPTFAGIFDGNGYAIVGLDVTESVAPAGLFGTLQESGVIRNLNVSGTVAPSGDQQSVGGIVGKNEGTIQNVTFTGTVSGGYQVGGIAGSMEAGAKIQRCRVNGMVSGIQMAGGVAGYQQGTISDCINAALVKQSDTEGLLETASDIGGIAGYNYGTILDCQNTAVIGYAHIGYNIGGIAGRSSGYVENCTNEGKIYGRKDVGGIVGQAEPYIAIELSESGLSQIAKEADSLEHSLKQTQKDVKDGTAQMQNRVQMMQECVEEMKTLLQEDKKDVHKIAKLQTQLNLIQRQIKFLKSDVTEDTKQVGQDVEQIFTQTQQLSDTVQSVLQEAETFSVENLTQDLSFERLETDTFGKIAFCENQGVVLADKNVGGIAGTVSLEYEQDPEDDTSFRLSLQEQKQYQLVAILLDNVNIAAVTAKKDCVGGICGNIDIGVVSGCENYGAVTSENGSYVGGIAGMNYVAVQHCFAKCDLAGERYIGGIVGSGSDAQGNKENSTVTACYAMPHILTYEQFIGAISGAYTGTYADCFFVSETLAGINRVSYTGEAESISYEALLNVAALPQAFQYVTVSFVSNGEVIDTITVPYADSLSEEMFPSVPTWNDREGRWEVTELSDMKTNVTIQAVYDDAEEVLASDKVREDARPIFLVEGQFAKEDVLTIETVQTELENATEAWNITIPEDDLLIHTLRYLPKAEDGFDVALYVKKDGTWTEVQTETVGSYLVCSAAGNDVMLAAVVEKTVWQPIAAAIVLGIGIVVGGVYIVRKKKSIVTYMLVIVTALLLGAAIFLAVLLGNHKLTSGVGAYQILQTYMQQPKQNLTLYIKADIGEETYGIQANVYGTDLQGRKVTCLESLDATFFYSDGILYLENGDAYQTNELCTDYGALLQTLVGVYQNAEIETSKQDDGCIYRIQVKEEAAQELLVYLLPDVSEQYLEMQTLQAELLVEHEKLTQIVLTAQGRLQDEARTKYDMTATFQVEDTEQETTIPDAVQKAILSDQTVIQANITKHVFRVLQAWEKLQKEQTMGVDMELQADCGVLSLEQEVRLISTLAEGERMNCIEKDGFRIYFNEDMICSENGYAVTTNREQMTDTAQLLALAYEICMQGGFSCTQVEEAYIYTVTLEESAMKQIAAYIAKESESLPITFENGTLQFVIREDTLERMQFICDGTLDVLFTKTPVSLSADLNVIASERLKDYTLPEKVLDKIKK